MVVSPTVEVRAAVRAEVVVVGGGICSFATALELARAGKDVLLIEAAAVGPTDGSCASTLNCGLIDDMVLPSACAARHPAELDPLLITGTARFYESLQTSGHDIDFARVLLGPGGKVINAQPFVFP
jgi:glycine/D-amino acid oxidase-like deaminating enzyme